MTRESKNNNDGAVFTYHERRKMDHGAAHLRLPAAALKPWHHCSLTLSSTESPVLTPHGVLYDREAILLNLLQQKQQIREQRIEQEAEQNRQQRARVRKLDAKRREEHNRFLLKQGRVHVKHDAGSSNDMAERENLASNFWLPGSDEAADSSSTQPAKRRKKDTLPGRTVCPITGKPLKSRDLITLKPTPFEKESISHTDDEDYKKTAESMDSSFICPVCQTALVNSVKPVALRTGTIVCKRCADDFVKKDAHDPITGAQLDLTSDIIEVQNSGTAFAASSSDNPASKEAKLYRPSVR